MRIISDSNAFYIRQIQIISLTKMKSLKLLFYLITSRTNRYYAVGSCILIISAILSIYLNFQSFNCLTKLSEYYNSQIRIDSQNNIFIDLQRNCFIITNSYVFAVFGVIIGIIVIITGHWKKKKIKWLNLNIVWIKRLVTTCNGSIANNNEYAVCTATELSSEQV
jgi:hypothetical protein